MSKLILALLVSFAVCMSACSDDTSEPAPPANNAEQDAGNSDTGEDASDAQAEDVPSQCPEGQLVCLDDFGQPDQSICGATARCVEGCCVEQFRCTADDDCAARAGEDNNCPDANLDCLCDEGTGSCFTRVCSHHSECEEGQICARGSCIAQPDEGDLLARILSAPSILGATESGDVVAVAHVAGDPAIVVPGVTIALSSSDTDIATVEDDAVQGLAGGTATITATVASNPNDPGDTAEVLVLDAAGDSIRVTVIDEATSRPIAGASVVAHADLSVATTNEDGAAILAAQGDFTVVAPDHSPVSVIGSSSRDLLVPVPLSVSTEIDLDEENRELIYDGLRNVDVVTGKPGFGNVTNIGELEIAINGFALGSDLLDLNFDLIIGPSVRQFLPANTPLPIPTEDPIDIPGGVTLYVNAQPVVARYLLVAPPGERTLWSLGGRISISQNPNLVPDIISGIDGDINIGEIVTIVLPFFENFYSGLMPGVQLNTSPQLPPREINVDLSVPTARQVSINTPELPTVNGNWVDGVLFLGGSIVPGQGFIPTGVTAALDEKSPEDEADGFVDGDITTPGVDPITLFMSPIHGGLQSERARYATALVALSFDQLDGGKEATSVILSIGEPGQPLAGQAALSRPQFPAFDENARWDADTQTIALGDAEQVDIVRCVLEGNGKRWVVWAHPSTTEIALPNLEGVPTFEDFEKRRIRVVGVDLEGAEFDTLVGVDGADLPDIIDFVTGFALLQL